MCNVSPSVQCSQWALRWWIIRTPAHALFIVNERREKLQKKLEGYFCHRLFWATTRHDSLSVTYEVSFTFQLRAIAFTCNTNRLRCRYIVILKLGSARIQVDAVGGSQWKATSGVTFPSGVYALTGSRVCYQPCITEPSRIVAGNQPSLVDNIFSNSVKPVISGNLYQTLSDHMPNFAIYNNVKQPKKGSL